MPILRGYSPGEDNQCGPVALLLLATDVRALVPMNSTARGEESHYARGEEVKLECSFTVFLFFTCSALGVAGSSLGHCFFNTPSRGN